MTVEIEYGEKPTLIIPKKRTSNKKNGNVTPHVDHVIMIQGSSNMNSAKMYSLAEVGGVFEHHKMNGNGITKINTFKNHVSDLPIIPDDDEKIEISPNNTERSLINDIKDKVNERPQSLQKNGYQINSNFNSSREIIDLSPIYENSSDACSSHDDIRSSNNDIVASKNHTILIEDTNDSNSPTPNSLSQTHSEVSLEMSLLESKHSMKRTKKRVNIVSETNLQNEEIEIEVSAFKCESETSGSPEKSVMSNSIDSYLTMNGTIKRGKKKGQSIDVTLNMSREELEVLEANIANEINKSQKNFKCSLLLGLHIILWTFICMPFVTFISGIYSFYIGTITWYNIFTHVSEGENMWIRVFVSPIVILLYPFLILIFTLSLGIYAGIAQLTYSWTTWWKEVCDLEKGFYGWFCNLLNLSDCSPYEVVILTDLKVVENTDMREHLSTEDISI